MPLALPKVDQSSLNVEPIDWAGLNHRYINPGELEVLVALVASVKPRRVVEFGVNSGRTAKALLDNVASIEAYLGIDVLPGYVPALPVQAKEVPSEAGHLAAGDRRFQLLLSKNGSHDFTADKLGMPFDAAFIDGDHSWRGVLHDTLIARAIVRPGGIIIWHDYHGIATVEVRDVVEAFAAAGSPIRYVEKTWLAFELR